MEAFNNWHFSDKVYNKDSLDLDRTEYTRWDTQPSAFWLLTSNLGTFQHSHTDWGWSFMLRLFLHIVGDIHQPLHCSNGFFNDSTFGDLPHGDFGGNLIKVNTSFGSIRNLHGLWDAAGSLYMENSPLDAAGMDRLEHNATTLQKMFPPSTLDEYDPDEFATCWARPVNHRYKSK